MASVSIRSLRRVLNDAIKAQEKREAEAAARDARAKLEYEASRKKIDADFEKMRQELGRHGASHGEFVEALFTNLSEKFNEIGYHFPKEARGTIIFRNEKNKVVAEVDRLLENGDTILAVEVKAKLKKDHVDEHIKRLGILSEHIKKRNDNRRVLGAVAGGVLNDRILDHAHSNGLYALVLNGESVSIADIPKNFVAKEW